MNLKPIDEIKDLTIDSIKKIEDEYIDLNNNIVMPDYFKFLKDNEIYSLRDGSHNKNIKALEILLLSNEVMKIFANMTRGIKLYKGNIVQYEIKCTDGGFNYWKFETDEFLKDYYDQVRLKNSLDNQLGKALVISLTLAYIISVFVVIFTVKNANFLKEYSDIFKKHDDLLLIFELGISLIPSYLIYKFINLPFVKQEKINRDYNNRLKEIKSYLESGQK